MRTNKYFMLLSILVIAAFLFAGCAPATVAPGEAPEEGAPTEAPSEVEEGVVEIIYMRQAEGVDAELDLVEEFNQTHPNIHVTVDSVPAE
ncbi:MAG: hypothetical protein KAV87_54895, partial [Desulfobacteraceae bacterium]|nr:hypothetical protein [Desulfobacteraceae bacterium]